MSTEIKAPPTKPRPAPVEHPFDPAKAQPSPKPTRTGAPSKRQTRRG
ncbi:MAG: hypothetical protein ACOYB2_10995 [Limnohabitans sp.]